MKVSIPEPVLSGSASAQGYLRSYRMMRAAIGVIGFALPVALLAGDLLFLDGDMLVRGSLSAYYHTGMRDVFVGALCAIAVFLITYRVAENRWDNYTSMIAGVAAAGVAIFPTSRPDAGVALTPLQESLGESTVGIVHYLSAAVFLALLAALSRHFAAQEGTGPWRALQQGLTAVIVLALVGMVVSQWSGVLDDYSLLLGEIIATVAFGVSWSVAGVRLDDRVDRG